MLNVTVIPSKKWYQRSRYQLNEDINFNGITVREGFTTDGLTLPWYVCLFTLICVLFKPTGRYFKSAIVHDWLLTIAPEKAEQAHETFRQCLIEQGATFWLAMILKQVVRGFEVMRRWVQRQSY